MIITRSEHSPVRPVCRGLTILAALLLWLTAANPAVAAQYRVALAAPAGGDGSADRPWASVQAALDSNMLSGGDTLSLSPGDYGALVISGARFNPPLTIAAAPGGQAHLENIKVKNSSGLILQGFDVWPQSPAKTVPPAVVFVDKTASDITLDHLDIRGWSGAEAYYTWTANDWLTRRNKGAQLDGTNVTLSNSTLTAVTTGIGVQGTRVTVLGNEVRGFSKDGMRVQGDETVVRGNTIRDCIKVDKNHDDGIQSWAAKGKPGSEVVGVVIDSNRIIEWTGPANHPLHGILQGIGLFNGPYRGWLIENNLILVSTHHGITASDMHDSKIVNNTVANWKGEVGKKPWIRLNPASLAGGNIVANNIAHAMNLGKGTWPDPNTVMRDPKQAYVNPAAGDYRLKPKSALIGTADPRRAPAMDITGARRPAKPSFGAYDTGL